MRVPNISTYFNSTYRLGSLTSDLESANEIASTQKQINEISDDPLGLSQVLSLTNTLGNLDQISKNVTMGKSWLASVENALDSANDLILEIKTDITRLANDSTTADERHDAIERVESVIQQIITLGNTQVNGNYVFSGTDTSIASLEYDTDSGKIIYKGNDIPFEIRTDQNLGVAVGRNGKDTFWDEEIQINSTNNTITFKEDNGHGDVFEKTLIATIPDGLYRKEALVSVIGNALNDVSAKQGYGVTYEVDYDDESQKYQIQGDGTYNGFISTEFMWETGKDAYVNNIQVSDTILPEDISLNVLNKKALTLGTADLLDGTKPFRVIWNETGREWSVENNPGYVLPGSMEGTSQSLDIDLNEDGYADISLRLAKPAQDQDYIQFEIISAQGDHSLGHEIGFNSNNTIQVPPVSDGPPIYLTDLIIGTSGNNTINFTEVNSTGGVKVLAANFNPTTAAVQYTDINALAAAIETAMEAASAAPTSGANTIDYAVSYDLETSRFNIRENGADLNELTINWTASTAAAETLGYYSAAGMDDVIQYPHSSVTIDYTNNTLAFSESILGTAGPYNTLMAVVPSGTYSSMSSLAQVIETAMEDVSVMNYNVSYDSAADQFQIQGSGGAGLTDFDLLWESGPGAGSSIGETLGYDPGADDTLGGLGPYNGDTAPVLMSLFSTTIDIFNNMIDFQEVLTSGAATTLQATIPSGTFTSMYEMETAIEKAMNDESAGSGHSVVYDVSYDEAGNHFDIIQTTGGAALAEFNLLWDSGANNGKSIGDTLGFDTSADDIGGLAYSSSSGVAPTWVSFDSTNNVIDFQEIQIDGISTGPISIEIPKGHYNDLNAVATEIQNAMRKASINGVEYSVSYDTTQGFLIKGSGAQIKGFDLLWKTGINSAESAGEKLGFSVNEDLHVSYAESDEDVINITINSSNNKIDFKEVPHDGNGKTTFGLTAQLEQPKVYKSMAEMAKGVEKALEAESRQNGNSIDYSVSWDSYTEKFTIKENGAQLNEFHLQWQSGVNAPLDQGGTGESLGSILGFDGDQDDIAKPLESGRPVEWGIFDSLIDLKQYLSNNDRDGIERTIGRLETNYDNMSSRIVDAGMKYSRLEVRESITINISLSLTERKSMIEDVDMIKSIMDLKNIETAYQAALSSTAKVLGLSLVDYLR